MTTRPHVICVTCHELQRASWISAVWQYCSHFRAIARRRRSTDTWVIDRNVSPEKARRHVDAALVRMAEYAECEGMSLLEANALVQKLFEHDKAKADK